MLSATKFSGTLGLLLSVASLFGSAIGLSSFEPHKVLSYYLSANWAFPAVAEIPITAEFNI
jgi:hypothetical protein